MNLAQFEQELRQNLDGIDIELDKRRIEQFYKYMELLLKWNENVNLTSIVEPEEIITKHFTDSLTIQKYVEKDATIIDVGTGAGFPGIPLKILREDVEVMLLDSLNKRVNFLEEVINELKLKKIKGVHGRAEELGKEMENREQYAVATSRAVAPLNILLEYMCPFVKIEGRIICMKGPKLIEELEKSERGIKLLGLEIEKIEDSVLPDTNMERKILILKKVEKTSGKYPRTMANIRKAPLWTSSTSN